MMYQYDNGFFIIEDAELTIALREPIVDITSGWKEFLGKDGSLWQRSHYEHKQLHGPSYTYYPNGNICSLHWYVHGKLHGRAQTFLATGVLVRSVGYYHGLCHGEALFCDASGKKIATGLFQHGKAHGSFVVYDILGKVLRETRFFQGQRHGIDTGWLEENFLLFCERWTHGTKTADIVTDFFQQAFAR